MYMCVYIYIYIYIYIYTYIYIYIYRGLPDAALLAAIPPEVQFVYRTITPSPPTKSCEFRGWARGSSNGDVTRNERSSNGDVNKECQQLLPRQQTKHNVLLPCSKSTYAQSTY